MTRMDDMGVREGDVVTYERGVEGEPGYVRAVKRVVESGEGNRPGNTTKGWLYAKQQRGYLRILSIEGHKPAVPDHAGAMAFVDGGVAVSDGTEYRTWMPFSIGGDHVSTWSSDPGVAPVEAIPVPAEALRDLVYYESSYHSSTGTLTDVIDSLEAFRVACNREWERSGIIGPVG